MLTPSTGEPAARQRGVAVIVIAVSVCAVVAAAALGLATIRQRSDERSAAASIASAQPAESISDPGVGVGDDPNVGQQCDTATVDIPVGFPADVPFPAHCSLDSAATTDGPAVGLTAPGNFEDVGAMLLGPLAANGWHLVSEYPDLYWRNQIFRKAGENVWLDLTVSDTFSGERTGLWYRAFASEMYADRSGALFNYLAMAASSNGELVETSVEASCSEMLYPEAYLAVLGTAATACSPSEEALYAAILGHITPFFGNAFAVLPTTMDSQPYPYDDSYVAAFWPTFQACASAASGAGFEDYRRLVDLVMAPHFHEANRPVLDQWQAATTKLCPAGILESINPVVPTALPTGLEISAAAPEVGTGETSPQSAGAADTPTAVGPGGGEVTFTPADDENDITVDCNEIAAAWTPDGTGTCTTGQDQYWTTMVSANPFGFRAFMAREDVMELAAFVGTAGPPLRHDPYLAASLAFWACYAGTVEASGFDGFRAMLTAGGMVVEGGDPAVQLLYDAALATVCP